MNQSGLVNVMVDKSIPFNKVLDIVYQTLHEILVVRLPDVFRGKETEVFQMFDDVLQVECKICGTQIARRLGYVDFESFCREDFAMRNILRVRAERDCLVIEPIIPRHMKKDVEKQIYEKEEMQKVKSRHNLRSLSDKIEVVIKLYERAKCFPTDEELQARRVLCETVYHINEMRGSRRDWITHGMLTGKMKELHEYKLNAEFFSKFSRPTQDAKRTKKINDIVKVDMVFEIKCRPNSDTLDFQLQDYLKTMHDLDKFYDRVREARQRFEEEQAARKPNPKPSAFMRWD